MAQRVTVVKVLLAAILTFVYLTKDVAAKNDTTIEEPPFQIIPVNDTLADDVDKGPGHPANLRAMCKMSHPVRFYAGNGCSSCTMGSMYVKSKRNGVCTGTDISGWACFDDNKARSMLIRTRFPRGGVIRVCDNPDSCMRGDYSIIKVKRKLTRDYCVKTFERNYQDSSVSVYYRRVSGLDGKVSRVVACSP